MSLRTSRDVDLADGYLRVHGTKTPAAERQIKLLPPLREELADLRALVGGLSLTVRSGDDGALMLAA